MKNKSLNSIKKNFQIRFESPKKSGKKYPIKRSSARRNKDDDKKGDMREPDEDEFSELMEEREQGPFLETFEVFF